MSLETGSSEQAILDMSACLALQQQCLEADSRYIAETHYQLGNAYLLNKDYKLAVVQFKLAKKVYIIIQYSTYAKHTSRDESYSVLATQQVCLQLLGFTFR